MLLRRLSVFAGGCTLEAAEAVCADRPEAGSAGIAPAEILDLLSSLVSKSMVIAEPGEQAGVRYHLLETMRQYARDKIQPAGDRDRLRAAHLNFFLQFAQAAEPELHRPAADDLARPAGRELDNLRAALDYSQAARAPGQAEAGLRLSVSLAPFWHIRGHRREAFAWLDRALAHPGVPARSLVRAGALLAAASLASGAAEAARAKAAESVEIFREAGPAGQPGLAYGLITLSSLVHLLGDFAPRLAMLEESAALFRQLDDRWGLALVLHNLAATLDPLVNYQSPGEDGSPAPLPQHPPAARNDHTAERAMYEESLALFRALGDRWALCMDLAAMGHMYFCWGQRAAGQAMFEENLLIVREFGNLGAMAGSLRHLGRDALGHDERDRAAALFEQSLAVRRAQYEDARDIEIDFMQAEMARRAADYDRAGRLLSDILVQRQSLGNRDFIAAVLDGQGRVARSQGQADAALDLHQRALALRREAGHPINLAHSFHALALLAAQHPRQAERAARLFGAARPYHAALFAYWADLPIWRAEHTRALAAIRSQLKKTQTNALLDEGEAMTLEQAYSYALDS